MILRSTPLCRRAFAAAAVALTALLGAGPAFAQQFPTNPKALTFPSEGTTHDFVKAAPVSDGFVAAWNRVTDGKTSVLLRRFGADGAQASDVTVIEDGAFAASPVEGRPEVVNLGGDRIGVVWMAAGPTLKGVVYDATTGQLSEPIRYFSKGALANVPHGLALMENGRVAMVTRRAVRGGEETTLFILDQSMAQVGASQVVERDESGYSKSGVFDHAVVANRSGAMVIYRTADQTLTQRWFDGTGALLEAVVVGRTFFVAPDSPLYAGFTIEAKALANGGYAVVTAEIGSEFRPAYVRAFSRKGELLRGGAASVDDDYPADYIQPHIFVFDQGFGVGWRNHPKTMGSVTQRAKFFSLERQELSKEIVTEYFGSDGPSGVDDPGEDSEFVRLPNGDSVRLFVADRRIYGDRIPAAKVGLSDKFGRDKMKGTSGADVLLGGRGKDRIKGREGDDVIDGGTETDVIDGGEGNDLIITKSDVNEDRPNISGGPGADVFVIQRGWIKIMDFEKIDRLDISLFNYRTRKEVLARAFQYSGYVYIGLSDQLNENRQGAAIRLRNFKLKDLTAANIIN